MSTVVERGGRKFVSSKRSSSGSSLRIIGSKELAAAAPGTELAEGVFAGTVTNEEFGITNAKIVSADGKTVLLSMSAGLKYALSDAGVVEGSEIVVIYNGKKSGIKSKDGKRTFSQHQFEVLRAE
jgi:hypothetical protein